MAFPGHAGRCWPLLGWRLVARIGHMVDQCLRRVWHNLAVRATDVPTGTMTFVFTDIVSSTRMWNDPLSMGPALRIHDEIVRDVLVGEGGYIFSTTGDGFGAAFEHADAAIRAAVLVQRRLGDTVWPNGADIAVRIGMHLGRAEERDGNFFGPPVNRSARVMAIAQGRQIVVTATVRDSAESWLPDDITLVPLGPVELKDITEPIEVYSVASRGVDVPPPPDPAPPFVAGNLPERVATLVGRASAMSDVMAALAQHRLVTLVGVGGVGKTTLATDVGRNIRRFTDGVWFVKLGQIQDGGAVVGAIADALGLSATGVTIDELIENTLRARRMLLLIDNCDHVLDAVGEAVDAILGGTPNVHVLATSREPLHRAGERVVSVLPLAVLPSGNGHSDAAELFLRRAAESGIELDPAAHGTAIDELCRRLDGLPLAIELAAAKTRAFDPSRLVDLLEHRFHLLGTGRRSADARHQTLRSTFDWSYDLLDERDRLVFDRLGVIAGPFDIDDALALCADVLPQVDVINSLTSLVDKSLVQRLATSPPFRLLESLREFSMEQLVAAGADQAVQRRHSQRFRDLAAEMRRTCMGPRERTIAELIAVQVNDFEAATRWAAANGELDWALSIVVDLNTIGFQRGWRPAPTWLADLLAAPPDPLPEAWADFLAASAATAVNELGAVRRARELAGAALSIDPDNPQALIVLAHLARHPNECYEYARRARETAVERHQLHWELDALTYQAFGALVDGNTEEALAIAHELHRRGDEIADRSIVGWSHFVVARALSSTDPARALVALDAARVVADEVANPNLEISSRRHRASALITGEDPEAAEDAIRSLLDRTLELGEIDQARRTCALAGVTRALRGDDETAALLIGRLGLPNRTPADLIHYQGIADALAERLGERHQSLLARGRAMSVGETIDLTIAALR
jgi:predicted ATPase/class 3 adenylate cyclase